jgi:hypothetical protein
MHRTEGAGQGRNEEEEIGGNQKNMNGEPTPMLTSPRVF